jgi:Lipocalin-like domain
MHAITRVEGEVSGGDSTQLVGSWRLVSVQFKMSDDGEVIEEHHNGVCTFDADGRWTAISTPFGVAVPETDGDRAAVFSRIVAFSGRFRLDGNQMFTKIDVAWNPAFVNAEWLRIIDLNGNRLTMTQPEWEHPFFPGRKTVVTVIWVREQR